MAKKKFSFTTAEGKVETRSSDRPYTHVIVGRFDLVRDRAAVLSNLRAGESWDYYSSQAKLEVGQCMPGSRYPLDQRTVDQARAFAAENPDREAYIEKSRQACLATIEKRHGTGDKSPEYVLQWSMSAANAARGMQAKAQHFVDVMVKPITA